MGSQQGTALTNTHYNKEIFCRKKCICLHSGNAAVLRKNLVQVLNPLPNLCANPLRTHEIEKKTKGRKTCKNAPVTTSTLQTPSDKEIKKKTFLRLFVLK